MKVFCIITNWICDGETGANVEVYATHEAAHKAFLESVEQERNCDHLYDEDDVVEEFSEEGETFCVYKDRHFPEDNFQMKVVEREVEGLERAIVRFHSELNLWMDAMVECDAKDVKFVEAAIEAGMDRFYDGDEDNTYLDEVKFALDEHKILYAVYCDPAAEDETSDEYDQLVQKKAAEYGKNFFDYII